MYTNELSPIEDLEKLNINYPTSGSNSIILKRDYKSKVQRN
jgi:hypothetical protein